MTDTLSARPDNSTSTIGSAHGLAVAASAAGAPAEGSPAETFAANKADNSPPCSASGPSQNGLRLPLPLPPSDHPNTIGEAAAWYTLRLGWPVVPGAPVLAVLGHRVPGAVRLGAVDVPALVGAAALERLCKAPGAAGPITDGQGRIRFLVDLGKSDVDAGTNEHGWLEDWRAAGVDLRVSGPGEYCPLPTPGMSGRSRVVWTVPPDPGRPALPPAREITAALDRAVRDAYPALWHVPTRGPSA